MSQLSRGLAVSLVAMLASACASAAGGDGMGDDDGPGPADAAPIIFIDAAVGPGPIDAGQGGPPDAMMMGAPDAGGGLSCASGATCAGAVSLGQVSGDTGNQKLNMSGTQSAWFRVRVSEDDSDVFGLTLRVGATLVNPPGADFDVFVYVNQGSDVVECATTLGTITNGGNKVQAEWGEGTIANGSDDGRNVSIEVRPVSGTCAAGQSWQLEVEGNWL